MTSLNCSSDLSLGCVIWATIVSGCNDHFVIPHPERTTFFNKSNPYFATPSFLDFDTQYLYPGPTTVALDLGPGHHRGQEQPARQLRGVRAERAAGARLHRRGVHRGDRRFREAQYDF